MLESMILQPGSGKHWTVLPRTAITLKAWNPSATNARGARSSVFWFMISEKAKHGRNPYTVSFINCSFDLKRGTFAPFSCLVQISCRMSHNFVQTEKEKNLIVWYLLHKLLNAKFNLTQLSRGRKVRKNRIITKDERSLLKIEIKACSHFFGSDWLHFPGKKNILTKYIMYLL